MALIVARMLDDFSREMDTTDTKMDNVMKKMAKVLHMSSGKTVNGSDCLKSRCSRLNIDSIQTDRHQFGLLTQM